MKKSQFSEEQIVRILQEAASGQKSQSQLCREHGIVVVFALGQVSAMHESGGK